MQREWQNEEKPYHRLLAFLNSHQSEEGMTLEEVRDQRDKRYQQVRNRLIKLFVWRGSHIPDELADMTLDRVTEKLGALQAYEGDPTHYVAGFVRHVYLESLRDKGKHEPLSENPHPTMGQTREAPIEAERRDDCLEKCLEKIPDPGDRRLILEYYQDDKRAKIDHRAEFARRSNLTVNALRIRCCRIRRDLRPCLQECLQRVSR